MTRASPSSFTPLLRDVSRSFFRSLHILPSAVRPQIGLAYLLARATDTIADTEVIPPDQRLDALEALRQRITGERAAPVAFTALAEHQALPAERTLLVRIEEAVAVLEGFSDFDRSCIRDVLTTITGGQALDLRRFGGTTTGPVTALETEADLDDYTYRVAGCVGTFWTRLCHTHLYPDAPLDRTAYFDAAVRFGKGLQLVNILRDLPEDLRRGRCYLPLESLRPAGLEPSDLLDPGNAARFRPVLRRHLEHAADHLAAGWRYTCATPRAQARVRIACALPLLIGADTLALLGSANPLNPSHRLKVPRKRVKALLWRAVLLHPLRRRWERLFVKPAFGGLL